MSPTVRRALARSAPIGVALFPVGVLFGLIAGRGGFRPLEVLLLSLLGFTGSGQFTYVKLAGEAVRWPLIFAIVLLMNLRYIPMAFTAGRTAGGGALERAALAHFVSDESYAVERPEDGRLDRAAIRLCILATWVASTALGAVVSTSLPSGFDAALGQLAFFPASAQLIALGLIRARSFADQHGRTGAWAIAAGAAAAFSALLLLGERYFWLPSTIATSAVIHHIVYRRAR
ncbi:hypothetical protein BE08_13295 [Sorangium cellulosum]|uniref:Branched-chain amino acid ABC transporter permease n=1 Tax=Sorangium cellulosum TaxID=56 RepID=A0A150PI47_SORCE|nr:hypothetical protein BE08_13295 [Sorangium cellulosum]